ncbi:hypothetical protein M3204_19305 [Mesobacillus subterraneus]|uniref:hypothetical protein n=1 Tax=Mesobacillus subterraneus TaxID=285983 RepID=UPI0020426BD0|nr:hypothetical protein [Mesobacillus subterraneus]MCM3666572.1 hypothetical protein [Mesobacillus subterraneus]MCM3685940.1 hypothetical protein [Mesobacillus subterraneus]
MKRKLLFYGTTALLILTVLIAMDRYKLYKEEKPPIPEITVNGQEVTSILGQYDWHGTKTKKIEPIKVMAGMNPTKVKEKQKLQVSFPPGLEPASMTISQVNTAPGLKKKSVEGNSMLIPKSLTPERIYFMIKAQWKKDYSTYYVKVDIEDLPLFYDFLSKDPEKLSVLAIVPRGESEKYDIPDEVKAKLDSFHISDDMEGLKKKYPELLTNLTPVYMIFNSEFHQQTVVDKETLINRVLDDGRD